jgi:signal transduction histidine kinase
MARALKSISSRMVLAVLVIHAVLLPLLSYGMITIVRNVQEEVFIDHVRIYSRVFADMLQSDGHLANEKRIVEALDSSILGGRSVHAAFQVGDQRLVSSIMGEEEAEKFVEDFHFGEHGDDVYYLAAPVVIGNTMAVLELGFDEEPTLLEIQGARDTILTIVLVYLVITVFLAVVLSALVSSPLQRLGHDSHKIASGDYTRKMSVDSDILEIRELTSDLENMRSTLVGINARLEGEIASREVAEAERRKAETHLRHMHRLQSIGTLAGGVAHEFNNVLLPILLYTDLALEDLPDDSPVRPNLERVLKLANRAKGLSEQILTFGRPSGEAMKVYADIAPVLDEAMSMVRALIPASIDILIDIRRPLGPVDCDPNELQQLVVNLCSNAYKAIAKGDGRIMVGGEEVEVTPEFVEEQPRLKAGRYVLLTVTDNGEGMESATIERMFDPFFSTRDVGKGTGLGLSVVHGIVAKHGGEILVSSEVGVGTKIGVYLPQAEACQSRT